MGRRYATFRHADRAEELERHTGPSKGSHRFVEKLVRPPNALVHLRAQSFQVQ